MKDPHLAFMTKLEELDSYTHTVLHQFPRIERHLLCADMRNCTGAMLRLAVVAWKRRQKASALFDLDVEVETLRQLIRKAHRLTYISDRRLGVWMQHTDEVGALVGGWIKHEKNKQELLQKR